MAAGRRVAGGRVSPPVDVRGVQPGIRQRHCDLQHLAQPDAAERDGQRHHLHPEIHAAAGSGDSGWDGRLAAGHHGGGFGDGVV